MASPDYTGSSASRMIGEFKNMKESLEDLRNTADAAALFVLKLNACGIGYKPGFRWGGTITVTLVLY